MSPLYGGVGNYVDLPTTHERIFGPEHALWTGEGTAVSGDQFSVRDCPKIIMAPHHDWHLIIQHVHSPDRKTAKHS